MTQITAPLIEQAKAIFFLKNNKCYIIDKFLRRAKEIKRDQPPGVVCYVFCKKIVNVFGTEDTEYYYLIARDYWFYSWADIDHAKVAKYKNSPGGGLDAEIVEKMTDPKTIGMTWLIIAVPNKTTDELEFWSIPATLFKELVTRHSTLHKGRFNNIDYGYSKEWLVPL